MLTSSHYSDYNCTRKNTSQQNALRIATTLWKYVLQEVDVTATNGRCVSLFYYLHCGVHSVGQWQIVDLRKRIKSVEIKETEGNS